MEYESLEFSDWRATIECLIGNISVTAALKIPPSAVESTARTCMRLETAVRALSDGPRHSRCVLIEIPVPAGIPLRPGAAIFLTVCIFRSSTTLRIPAMGHIHCDTCNHEKAGKGAVWRAACSGDAAALEAALSAGGSTEETDGVRMNCSPLSQLHHDCISGLSQTETAFGWASYKGHVEAVRILLAAGAEVNDKERVSLHI